MDNIVFSLSYNKNIMKFADIIGQESVKQHLINSVKDNRISHAQLILGREGYGSLPLALAYAQYINCQHRTDTDSCGECPSCRQISKLSFPDVHFVFPVPPTGSSSVKPISDTYMDKWTEFLSQNPYGSYQQWIDFVNDGKNSQGVIRVEESSEIIRKLSMKSFNAEYKIMIIWQPEKMNGDAANRLLKLIEEPYPKTLFLLVAESSEFILPTILSRTQLVKVSRIGDSELTDGLQRALNISRTDAESLARISEGDFNRAMQYGSSSADLLQNFELFKKLMRTSYSFKVQDMVRLAEELGKINREQQKSFLTYSERMVRENLLMNRHLPNMARFTADEGEFAQKFSPFIHPQSALAIAKELDKAYYHISRNASGKIVFCDTIFKIGQALRSKAD